MREPVTFAFDEEESLPSIVARLADDARHLAKAEIALQKARIGDKVTAYRRSAIFFAGAGVLALAALIALLVGAIMALATVMHPAFATLVVVVVTLAIAGMLAFVGKSHLASKPEPALPETVRPETP